MWEEEGRPTSDQLATVIFLAHGCHAELDALKNVNVDAVDRATKGRWSQAGLRHHSPPLTLLVAEDEGVGGAETGQRCRKILRTIYMRASGINGIKR